MKIFKISHNRYFFVSFTIYGDYVVGEEFWREDGVLKYETKFISLSSIKDSPIVLLNSKSYADIQAKIIEVKTQNLVNRIM